MMSSLERYTGGRAVSRSEQRHQSRALVRADHQAELAEARVDAVSSTTEHAQMSLARIDRVRQMATQMAPDTAEMQMMLEVDAWMEMRGVIRDLGRRLR